MFTFVAAAVVFCVVQDRVTAAGVSRYLTGYRAAAAAGESAPSLDAVMSGAIRRSVYQGLAWSSGVLAVGLAGVAIVSRRRTRG